MRSFNLVSNVNKGFAGQEKYLVISDFLSLPATPEYLSNREDLPIS